LQRNELIELIIGGARSGKSRTAEARAQKIYADASLNYNQLLYVATAQSLDKEMAERIKRHQQQRADHWQLIEEPLKLAQILAENDHSETIILIECLSLWLTNLLCHSDPELFEIEKQKLIQQLKHSQARVIIVSNETGLGIVPMGELNRRFVDEAGFLHQKLAQISERVTLVVAGLEHHLKAPELKK
jgi:adenosylcobinamide kinase / adenosylcobinamide-phosphate guanylyltransferase